MRHDEQLFDGIFLWNEFGCIYTRIQLNEQHQRQATEGGKIYWDKNLQVCQVCVNISWDSFYYGCVIWRQELEWNVNVMCEGSAYWHLNFLSWTFSTNFIYLIVFYVCDWLSYFIKIMLGLMFWHAGKLLRFIGKISHD